MAFQDQKIDHSTIQNSSVQQVQAGRDAVSFLNSYDNQVIIENTFLRLFGRSESTQVDWDWGKLLLEKKQLPEIRQRLTDTLGRDRIFMDVAIAEQLSWVNRSPLEADRRLQIDGEDCGILDPDKLLIETFGRDDIGGKLLILGAPGSGKTTALLSLAEQLVCGALAQPKTLQKTRSILSWIARQLQANKRVDLLIEKMQPSWIESTLWLQSYRVIGGLIVGLIGGLGFGLIFGLTSGLTSGLIFGLIFGLSSGLTSGLIFGVEDIESVEFFANIGMEEILQTFLKLTIVWLLWGLVFSLVFSLPQVFVPDLKNRLVLSLIYGLSLALILTLGLLLLPSGELEVRSYPNQGIWNSLRNIVWTSFFIYPHCIILILMMALTNIRTSELIAPSIEEDAIWRYLIILVSRYPLKGGLILALIIGLVSGGGLTCVQHFCLRLVLWQSGIIPWNFARFLNYCVERRLLLRVGGRYRFLHRELLDYFAQSNH